MLTDISLAKLDEVHPELKRRILLLDSLIPSLNLQVVQGFRTCAEQDALYAEGRTVPGPDVSSEHPLGVPVTDAKGGYSAHNFGYAVDLCPFDIMPGQPDWNILHPAWQKMLATAPQCQLAEGATWRTFPDNPHFYPQELPADPTDEMRLLIVNGRQAVWSSFPPLVNV